MAIDIFKHNNGIVHKNSHNQRKGKQGHEIQRKSEQIHPDKGGNKGGRDGNKHDQGVAQAVQEEHHDQSNKQHGKHQIMLYGSNSLNRKS